MDVSHVRLEKVVTEPDPQRRRRRIRRLTLLAAVFGLLTGVASSIERESFSREQVAEGKALFEHTWRPDDELAAEGDGLGPVFNEKSCVACHFEPAVGGAGPNDKNVSAFVVFPAPDRPGVTGGVVHASATRPELRQTNSDLSELFPTVRDGVRIDNGCTTRFADFDPVVMANVNTPALFGAGLLDRISDRAVRQGARAQLWRQIGRELQLEFDSPGAGRLHVLPDGRVGKLGWKAQFASLEEFVAAACAVEVGLSNPLRKQDQPRRYAEDKDAPLDMNRKQLDSLVAFVASLPRPEQVLPDNPQKRQIVETGESLFDSVGCADCHTPDLGDVAGIYSDLLLHSVESPQRSRAYETREVVTPLPEEHPQPIEWKTPPLWGVADTAPYFHDGGCPTLESAILRHDGSAAPVTEKFRKLHEHEQDALIAFLETLRAPQEPIPVRKTAAAEANQTTR